MFPADPPPLPPTLRLFIALLLPEDWEEYLVQAQRRLEQGGPGGMRWVKRDTLHLTLVFLGNQPRARLESVVAAMESAAAEVAPFRLALGELGTLGSPRQPRVLWMGVQPSGGGLDRLHQALVRQLGAANVAFDRRELRPHVTLGRAQRRGGEQAAARRGQPERRVERPSALSGEQRFGPAPPAFEAAAASLMLSELRREGPRYTELARATLSGPRASASA